MVYFWEGPAFAIHLSWRDSLLNVSHNLIQKAGLHGGNPYFNTISDTIAVGVFFQLLNEYAKLVG